MLRVSKRRLLVLGVMMLALAGGGLTVNARELRGVATERMAKLLSNTRIHELKVQDAPLRDVLDQVKHLAQLASPDNDKLNLMYLGKQDKLDIRVSCELSDLPLAEVLRYLCMASGLKQRVEANAVILFDETIAMEETQTKIFNVPPNSPIFAPQAVK
jgi:hypothetical protein